MEEAGIKLEASLVLEGFENFRGGLEDLGFAGASTFDLSLGLDTDRLFHWAGWKFFAELEGHGGRDPSTELVGDLQVFDKLNASSYLQLFELWYQQELFDGKLRLKLGKADANSEFSVVDNGLPFLNSSSQVSPTVFLLPTTPDPMPGAAVFFEPDESWYAGFAAYYANRSVGFANFVGSPQDAQLSESGAFLIGEAGLRWRQAPWLGEEGNLKLGAWGHTGTFTEFDGSEQRGVYGFYAILDQTLWQPGDERGGDRGLRIFLEYGRTQPSVNPIDEHIGGGATWTGPAVSRPDDVGGFCLQYAHMSPEAGLPEAYELALEVFYQLPITRWMTFMPDLQYIVQAGGQYPDALVGTLRFTLDL